MDMEDTNAAPRDKQGEFCWVDLSARDIDGQTAFYEKVFGWEHRDVGVEMDTTYRLFILDGAVVAAATEMTPDLEERDIRSAWNTYVSVEDADASLCLATGLGAAEVTPVTDVGREGRMAGIEDPMGAALSFWQPLKMRGFERFGEPGTFIWADLRTPDPKKAIAFYPLVLPSWKVTPVEQSPTPFWTIAVDGTAEAGIMPIAEGQAGPPDWLVYFAVEDTRAFAEAAIAAGADVKLGPEDVGSTVYAVLADPAGATFAVMQPMTGM